MTKDTSTCSTLTINETISDTMLQNAHGPIPYNMTNDYMFRAVLQSNNKVLRGMWQIWKVFINALLTQEKALLERDKALAEIVKKDITIAEKENALAEKDNTIALLLKQKETRTT